MCMHTQSLQSCPTLWDPIDCSPPVHGIFQARILEWVAVFFFRGSSPSRDQTHVSCSGRRILLPLAPPGSRRSHKVVVLVSEVAQLCPTLCDPKDCSLPGSSVHGILQARILEWVAISLSRGSSPPRDRTQVSHIAGRRFNLWTKGVFDSCDPMDCGPPGSSDHRVLQEYWSELPFPAPGNLPNPGIELGSPPWQADS